MDFRRIPKVPTAQELIDIAFGRASKVSPPKGGKGTMAKSRELARVGTISKATEARLNKIVRSFPSVDDMHPFYEELVEVVVGLDQLKKSLGAVQWCRKSIKKVCDGAMQEIRANVDSTDRMGAIRRAAYGRVASLLKQVDKDLAFLGDAREALKGVPSIVADQPTIVIAGYPNVGKSSFLRQVTNAVPEINSYPFTTKGVVVGHWDDRQGRVQLVDTPGVLDRPMEARNDIERQAIMALRHVAHTILFVLDPSGTAGYPLETQVALLEEVRALFPKTPMLVVENKSDVATTGERLAMSCQTGDGVEAIRDEAIRMARRHHGDLLRAEAALMYGDGEEE